MFLSVFLYLFKIFIISSIFLIFSTNSSNFHKTKFVDKNILFFKSSDCSSNYLYYFSILSKLFSLQQIFYFFTYYSHYHKNDLDNNLLFSKKSNHLWLFSYFIKIFIIIIKIFFSKFFYVFTKTEFFDINHFF